MSRFIGRLAPRIWFTRRALTVALSLVVLLALGSAWPPLVGLAVAASIACAGAVIADFAVLARANVAVTREDPERFILGDRGALRYRADNRSATDLRLEIVETPVPRLSLGETPLAVTAGARAHACGTLEASPRDRGDGELIGFAYRMRTALGLVARVVRVTAPAAVRVWPELSLLRRRGTLTQHRRTIEAGLRRLQMRGTGTDFESLREYAVGDSFRSIAWRATARRGKPIVVANTVERSQDVVLVLDAGRLMLGRLGAQRKFDYAIAAALTLAGAAATSGDRVGAVAFASTIVDAIAVGNGRAHAAAIAQRMHALQPRFEESDYEGAFALVARRGSKRSLIVVFTDMFDPVASAALLAHLRRLVVRHLVVVVLLSDNAVADALEREPRTADAAYRAAVAIGVADDRRRAIAMLGRLGIIVVDVPANEVSVALVNRYIDVKARGAL